jgi:uncharacterized protein YndB with AHSA1/START domain
MARSKSPLEYHDFRNAQRKLRQIWLTHKREALISFIELTISYTIKAKPGEIFDLWLDSKRPGGPWFGCERVILNAVVDGLFYHCVRHEGRAWAHYGRFIRLERPRLIEHTWVSEATRGTVSIVTLTFDPREGETETTLRHSGLPDDAMGRQHEEGWNFILSAIASRFKEKGGKLDFFERLLAERCFPQK